MTWILRRIDMRRILFGRGMRMAPRDAERGYGPGARRIGREARFAVSGNSVHDCIAHPALPWIPAFAGMTK